MTVLHQLLKLEMDQTCNKHCQMPTMDLDSLPMKKKQKC